MLPSSHFHPSWRGFDAFTSLGRMEDALGGPTRRGEHPGIYAYARLKPGVSVEQAQANMVEVAKQLGKQYPKTNASSSVTLKSLHGAPAHSWHRTAPADLNVSLVAIFLAAGSEFRSGRLKGIELPRKPTLGRWLTDKRTATKKTRQQIADAIGVTYGSIRFWETDSCRPTDDNLSSICKALRASVREARSLA